MLLFDLVKIVFDDLQDVLFIAEDSQILFDFIQQTLMLIAEFLLFQVDQLAQCHFQNGIGLNRGQMVDIRIASFFFEDGKTFVPQSPFQHRSRALDPHQANFRFGLSL